MTPATNPDDGDGKVIDPLELRISLVQSASCTCDTKTHEERYHDPLCRYRIVAEARTEIERLSASNDKYFWQVRYTCVRAQMAEVELAEARAALVEHNDLLRSAFTAAQRDAVADVAGTTNYRLLADRAHEILKRHHATSNAARVALTKGA